MCGHFVTGVTVVTSGSQADGSGSTVNSFTSVSLNPPMVLVCLHENSRLLPVVQRSGGFVVNFLTHHQESVAWAFAGRQTARLESVPHHRSAHGLPVLSESLAHVECRLVSEYDGGDHTILLGEVIGLGTPVPEEDPLVFFQGSMRELGSAPAPAEPRA
ncbi:flavin reductase family protein [Streptomyces sp. H27-C3]|uniref:flavin reductase family protein n=1 Tax=Streptomyces sp. H27-C3 TaxID=3046305 RepID=UPI0024B9F834|nr:flavin reductase family protein [Streptomyces sp. H27-C3]MDJ0466266.1 flavin reductase family protein [Streptomyces sp. H27-C3]